MPLKRPVLPISVDEFRRMAHRIGWKHEYWDGAARLSPAWTATIELELDVRDAKGGEKEVAIDCLPQGYHCRPVRPEDRDGLVDLFYVAFDQAVRYAGYSDQDYREASESNVDHALARIDDCPVDSLVIESDTGRTTAAILIIRNREDGFVVQPIMVHPEHARRGLGRHIFLVALKNLRAAGVEKLRSHCQLSNAASLAWHSAMGFIEVPRSHPCAHRATHHRWMSEHQSAKGNRELATLHDELSEAYHQLHEVCQDRELERFRRETDC